MNKYVSAFVLVGLVATVLVSGCVQQDPTAPTCVSDWSCTDWEPSECPESRSQSRACTDINECGKSNTSQPEERACTPVCVPDWSCTDWEPSECPESEIQTRNCTDSNECDTEEDKPTEEMSCTYEPVVNDTISDEELEIFLAELSDIDGLDDELGTMDLDFSVEF